MKIEFSTRDEAGSYFVFAVHHPATAGGWVPVKGDRMYYGGQYWDVVERDWIVEEGELAILRVWLGRR